MSIPFQTIPTIPPVPPRPGRKGSAFFLILRVALLLGFLGGTAWLVELNRRHDPRFYWFLETTPGRWLASHLFKKGPLARSMPDDRPLSAEELIVRDELEKQLLEAHPSHRLVLKDGRVIEGRLVEKGAREIAFEQRAARQASLTSRWPVARVAAVEAVTAKPPPVLNRDVRFKLQFPELNYFRSPPFTMLTDQTDFDAQDSVKELRRLHQELAIVFAPLVTNTNMQDGIHLLFFSEEDAYREHCRAFAPSLEHSAGFFSPVTGRLALFNQRSSDDIAGAHQSLARQAESVGRMRLSPTQRVDLASQVRAIKSRINQMADRASLETLRHEGAHQWLHLAGVHSRHFAENTWLVEGLAMWCESDPGGGVSSHFKEELALRLKESGAFSWTELITHRSPSGFFAFTDEERIATAYIQSWVAVHWLMQTERREAFFQYLQRLRDRSQVRAVATRSAVELLCADLGMDSEALFAAFDDHVRGLTGRPAR